MQSYILALVIALIVSPITWAGEISRIEDHYEKTSILMADQIWRHAELGYQEENSSNLLQEFLVREDFELQTGVEEMSTAFVATAGSGSPIIAILAEFDALPGLSQKALPYREARESGAPGHACGHHLFGSASVTAGGIKNFF